MPTVARCPRACVICERCPASAAPTRDLCLHADDALVRREQRAGAAPAPCRPGIRSTRAARPICAAPLRPGPPRTRDGMPTTAWRDASSAPDLRRPPSTWPATAPACLPQSTAPAFVLAVFHNSTPARQGAYGAQAHSSAPQVQCASACTSQRPSAVSLVVARSAPRQQPASVCARPLRLLPATVAGPSLAPPRLSAALRGASSGRG